MRVAVEHIGGDWTPEDLIAHLGAGTPSIRTRNHQAAQGRILIDCRELDRVQAALVAARIRGFFYP